jgi:hypothetical protein
MKTQVIIKAADGSDESLRSLYRSTYGLVFFGVPSKGLNNQNLLAITKGQPNQDFVRSLGERSQYLDLLHDLFYAKFALPMSEVISVYESKETETVMVCSAIYRLPLSSC